MNKTETEAFYDRNEERHLAFFRYNSVERCTKCLDGYHYNTVKFDQDIVQAFNIKTDEWFDIPAEHAALIWSMYSFGGDDYECVYELLYEEAIKIVSVPVYIAMIQE